MLRVLALFAVLACPLAAAAQDAPAPEPQATEAPATAEPQPAAAAQAEPAAAEVAPPVGVVPMPTGDLTPEMVNAIRDAVVAGAQPLVHGRAVHPLANEERLITLLECPDAQCIGAQLADLGAIAGVLVRMHREPAPHGHAAQPQPVSVTLEVVDPVSGAARIDPIRVDIPADQLGAPAEALAPAIAQLAPAMPPPPPRASLLVAVNVDGARVRVDDEDRGRTPIAPLEIAPGRHLVEVSRPGFLPRRQPVDVGGGEDARLDILLEVDPSNAELLEADAADVGGEGGSAAASPWYTRWYVIAGAGAVLAIITIGVVIAATSGGDDGGGQTGGIPVPPIE